MSGVVAMLLVVLAILAVLTVRQLLTIGANARQHGGIREGWNELRAQNTDELSHTLLRIHQWQTGEHQDKDRRSEQVIATSHA